MGEGCLKEKLQGQAVCKSQQIPEEENGEEKGRKALSVELSQLRGFGERVWMPKVQKQKSKYTWLVLKRDRIKKEKLHFSELVNRSKRTPWLLMGTTLLGRNSGKEKSILLKGQLFCPSL